MHTEQPESEQTPQAVEPAKNNTAEKAAGFFTVILHPLLIPLWGSIVLLYGPTYLSILPPSLKGYILGAVGLSTFLFPVLLLGILRSLKLIPESHYARRGQFLVMTAVLLGYLICFYLLHRYISIGVLPQALIGGMILVAVCFAVRFFYGISIHMAALGGLIAILLDVMLKGYGQMLPVLLVLLIAAGIVGTSRLYLGKHNLSQVFFGLAIGIAVTLTAVNLL